jgi:hypothetical protein
MNTYLGQSKLGRNDVKKVSARRFIGVGALALAGLLGTANSVAAPTTPDFQPLADFAKGDACKDFQLFVLSAGSRQVSRQFVDEQNNTIRFFDAGRGVSLKFVNGTTGATLDIRPNGSVSRTTVNTNTGAVTSINTGHNVLILQASDTGGPSVIQYVGRLVYTVAPNGVFTVEGFSGKQIDICAALSS